MIILSEPDDHTITMGGQGHPDATTQIEDGNHSLWSLTLNEIELKSGKSFGSMNMDEFLGNLWSNTDDPHHHAAAGQVLAQPNHHPNNNNDGDLITNEPLERHHQSSSPPLISIPSPLCNKTVDEVWFEIQRDQSSTHHHLNPTIDDHHDVVPQERQQSLGEITLEDFLVQAGVVRSAATTTTTSSASQLQQMKVETTPLVGSFRGGFGTTDSYQMMNNDVVPSEVYHVGEASSYNPDVQMDLDNEQGKGKIIVDGPPEVLVERRQRRMIKNRESAARSRARKQAYTMELELELNYLKEENKRLKQTAEIEQKTRERIMRMTKEAILRGNKKTDKLRSLRRTASI